MTPTVRAAFPAKPPRFTQAFLGGDVSAGLGYLFEQVPDREERAKILEDLAASGALEITGQTRLDMHRALVRQATREARKREAIPSRVGTTEELAQRLPPEVTVGRETEEERIGRERVKIVGEVEEATLRGIKRRARGKIEEAKEQRKIDRAQELPAVFADILAMSIPNATKAAAMEAADRGIAILDQEDEEFAARLAEYLEGLEKLPGRDPRQKEIAKATTAAIAAAGVIGAPGVGAAIAGVTEPVALYLTEELGRKLDRSRIERQIRERRFTPAEGFVPTLISSAKDAFLFQGPMAIATDMILRGDSPFEAFRALVDLNEAAQKAPFTDRAAMVLGGLGGLFAGFGVSAKSVKALDNVTGVIKGLRSKRLGARFVAATERRHALGMIEEGATPLEAFRVSRPAVKEFSKRKLLRPGAGIGAPLEFDPRALKLAKRLGKRATVESYVARYGANFPAVLASNAALFTTDQLRRGQTEQLGHSLRDAFFFSLFGAAMPAMKAPIAQFATHGLTGMGVTAVSGYLSEDWDTLTPQQKAQELAAAGIGFGLAGVMFSPLTHEAAAKGIGTWRKHYGLGDFSRPIARHFSAIHAAGRELGARIFKGEKSLAVARREAVLLANRAFGYDRSEVESLPKAGPAHDAIVKDPFSVESAEALQEWFQSVRGQRGGKLVTASARTDRETTQLAGGADRTDYLLSQLGSPDKPGPRLRGRAAQEVLEALQVELEGALGRHTTPAGKQAPQTYRTRESRRALIRIQAEINDRAERELRKKGVTPLLEVALKTAERITANDKGARRFAQTERFVEAALAAEKRAGIAVEEKPAGPAPVEEVGGAAPRKSARKPLFTPTRVSSGRPIPEADRAPGVKAEDSFGAIKEGKRTSLTIPSFWRAKQQQKYRDLVPGDLLEITGRGADAGKSLQTEIVKRRQLDFSTMSDKELRAWAKRQGYSMRVAERYKEAGHTGFELEYRVLSEKELASRRAREDAESVTVTPEGGVRAGPMEFVPDKPNKIPTNEEAYRGARATQAYASYTDASGREARSAFRRVTFDRADLPRDVNWERIIKFFEKGDLEDIHAAAWILRHRIAEQIGDTYEPKDFSFLAVLDPGRRIGPETKVLKAITPEIAKELRHDLDFAVRELERLRHADMSAHRFLGGWKNQMIAIPMGIARMLRSGTGMATFMGRELAGPEVVGPRLRIVDTGRPVIHPYLKNRPLSRAENIIKEIADLRGRVDGSLNELLTTGTTRFYMPFELHRIALVRKMEPWTVTLDKAERAARLISDREVNFPDGNIRMVSPAEQWTKIKQLAYYMAGYKDFQRFMGTEQIRGFMLGKLGTAEAVEQPGELPPQRRVLRDMKLRELRKLGKKFGVKRISRLKKSELIKALSAARQQRVVEQRKAEVDVARVEADRRAALRETFPELTDSEGRIVDPRYLESAWQLASKYREWMSELRNPGRAYADANDIEYQKHNARVYDRVKAKYAETLAEAPRRPEEVPERELPPTREALEATTLKEIRKLARPFGVKRIAKLRKAQLIDELIDVRTRREAANREAQARRARRLGARAERFTGRILPEYMEALIERPTGEREINGQKIRVSRDGTAVIDVGRLTELEGNPRHAEQIELLEKARDEINSAIMRLINFLPPTGGKTYSSPLERWSGYVNREYVEAVREAREADALKRGIFDRAIKHVEERIAEVDVEIGKLGEAVKEAPSPAEAGKFIDHQTTLGLSRRNLQAELQMWENVKAQAQGLEVDPDIPVLTPAAKASFARHRKSLQTEPLDAQIIRGAREGKNFSPEADIDVALSTYLRELTRVLPAQLLEARAMNMIAEFPTQPQRMEMTRQLRQVLGDPVTDLLIEAPRLGRFAFRVNIGEDSALGGINWTRAKARRFLEVAKLQNTHLYERLEHLNDYELQKAYALMDGHIGLARYLAHPSFVLNNMAVVRHNFEASGKVWAKRFLLDGFTGGQSKFLDNIAKRSNIASEQGFVEADITGDAIEHLPERFREALSGSQMSSLRAWASPSWVRHTLMPLAVAAMPGSFLSPVTGIPKKVMMSRAWDGFVETFPRLTPYLGKELREIHQDIRKRKAARELYTRYMAKFIQWSETAVRRNAWNTETAHYTQVMQRVIPEWERTSPEAQDEILYHGDAYTNTVNYVFSRASIPEMQRTSLGKVLFRFRSWMGQAHEVHGALFDLDPTFFTGEAATTARMLIQLGSRIPGAPNVRDFGRVAEMQQRWATAQVIGSLVRAGGINRRLLRMVRNGGPMSALHYGLISQSLFGMGRNINTPAFDLAWSSGELAKSIAALSDAAADGDEERFFATFDVINKLGRMFGPVILATVIQDWYVTYGILSGKMNDDLKRQLIASSTMPQHWLTGPLVLGAGKEIGRAGVGAVHWIRDLE